MLRFRLFGIPVTVEPWHWLILAFVCGGLHVRDRETLLTTLIGMAAGFLSILVHEFGHALTGRHFGGRPDVVLHGLGGVARFPGARFRRNEHIIVTAAGPVVQLVLGGIAFLVLWKAALPNEPLRTFFIWLWLVSVFWAVLNLIPVFPLDGGQILYQSLGPQRHMLALRISMFTAITAAVLLFLLTKSFLFPILLGFMAWQNYQMMQPQWR